MSNEWIEKEAFVGVKHLHAPCAGAPYGGATVIAGRGAIVCADCGAEYAPSPPVYGETQNEIGTILTGHVHNNRRGDAGRGF